MGSVASALSPAQQDWISQQKMFFVATAPLAAAGHVNCSPKGFDTFRILDEQTVAYLDFVGSGIETVAHLRENGRMCIMFCAFEGQARILRLHGRGEVIEPEHAEFAALRARFAPDSRAAERTVIRLRVERVSNSCGYGVPLYSFEGERDDMTAWRDRKGQVGSADYQRKKNAASIDGLAGLQWVQESSEPHR
ncbi:MAG: pyridoxamine 5'-phosphate oxidase family protein [bacterium]|nr:pyridoxamine 5'-phosphate oxidase family protein [bacterium]